MDRFDFYFEQLVTQADMDEFGDQVENADHSLQADNGYTGVVQGLDVVEAFPTPNLTVTISSGVAYDPVGQRIFIPADQTLDLATDSSGNPTAVAGPGNEKWLSVFVSFDRSLSDPRVDGNGLPLLYRRDESFAFIIDQGGEAVAGTPAVLTSINGEDYSLSDGQTLLISVNGTAPQTATFNTGDFVDINNADASEVALVIQSDIIGVTAADVAGLVEITSLGTGSSATIEVVGGTASPAFGFPVGAASGGLGPSRPALRPDAILLADVLLRNGTLQVFDAPDLGTPNGVIDLLTRRQFVFVYNGASFIIREGTITGFANALAQELSDHINNLSNPHSGGSIEYDPTIFPIGSNPKAWPALQASYDMQAAIDAVYSTLTDGTLSGSNQLTFETPADGSLTAGRGTDIFSINAGVGTSATWIDLVEDMVEALANRLTDDTITGDWTFTGDPTFAGTGNVIFNQTVEFNGNVFFQGTNVQVDGKLDINEFCLGNPGQTTDLVEFRRHANVAGPGNTDFVFGTVGTDLTQNAKYMVEFWIMAAETAGANAGYARKVCYRFDTDPTQINNLGAIGADDINDFTAGDLVTSVQAFGLANLGVRFTATALTYNIHVMARLIHVAE